MSEGRLLRLLFALALAAGTTAACRHAAPPPTVLPADLAPWVVAPGDLGTQRLFRAHYDGPEGEGGFRIIFRLTALDRYQAVANAAFGRKLWSLDVAGAEGLWLDHRKDSYCRLQGRLELAGSLLAPLPFRAFPALLLGRVPETPAASPRREGGELVFRGGGRRRWRVEVAGPRVLGWTLLEGSRPVARWEVGDGESTLSDRDHGVRLRWREVVREPLGGDLAPLGVPPGYREVACSGIDLSVAGEEEG